VRVYVWQICIGVMLLFACGVSLVMGGGAKNEFVCCILHISKACL